MVGKTIPSIKKSDINTIIDLTIELNGGNLKLFPLKDHKIFNPCKSDKCLVKMCCTQYCQDKVDNLYTKAFIHQKLSRLKHRLKLIIRSIYHVLTY